MRLMNVNEVREVGLKEKVVIKAGEWLSQLAMEKRVCRFGAFYEPELTTELLEEMLTG